MYEDEIPVGQAKDLTGEKFGKLTVLYRVKNKGTNTAWKCKCDCGTIKIITAKCLVSGNTISCGCYNREKSMSDISGQRFGQLIAIKPTDNRRSGSVEWECKCDCGNIHYVSSCKLKEGSVTSCGCKNKPIDITNQRFGKLIAIKMLNKEKIGDKIMWECRCDCGKITKVRGTSLRYGEIQSCGDPICMGLEKDMKGLIFGKLKVISKAGKEKGAIYWNCECECGNRIKVRGSALRKGQKSCGCLSSKGELKITKILKQFNKNFEQEKKFDTCLSEKNKPYRFDFYVENNYLIEYDGEQHFYYSDKGWNTKEKFEKTKKHDEDKTRWCKENNIPLIRIPFKKLETLCIEDLMLETTQFRVV